MEFNERDLFAALAMCGFIVNGATIRDVSDETIAEYSYNMADAMLEIRKKEEPEEGIAAIKKGQRTK
jgi:hypothetical protein